MNDVSSWNINISTLPIWLEDVRDLILSPDRNYPIAVNCQRIILQASQQSPSWTAAFHYCDPKSAFKRVPIWNYPTEGDKENVENTLASNHVKIHATLETHLLYQTGYDYMSTYSCDFQ